MCAILLPDISYTILLYSNLILTEVETIALCRYVSISPASDHERKVVQQTYSNRMRAALSELFKTPDDYDKFEARVGNSGGIIASSVFGSNGSGNGNSVGIDSNETNRSEVKSTARWIKVYMPFSRKAHLEIDKLLYLSEEKYLETRHNIVNCDCPIE